MANNTIINTGSGGDIIRDIDRGPYKTQVVQLDVGGATGESLLVATAKGTQGSAAVPIQELKDGGRNLYTYYMPLAVRPGAATTEVLPAAAYYRSGAVNSLATSTAPPVITAGKTLRITSISLTYIPQTVAGGLRFCLRYNSSGVATNASTIVGSWIVPGLGTTAGLGVNNYCVAVPDGMEFAGGGGICMTIVNVSTTGVPSATQMGAGQFCITGYEY